MTPTHKRKRKVTQAVIDAARKANAARWAKRAAATGSEEASGSQPVAITEPPAGLPADATKGEENAPAAVPQQDSPPETFTVQDPGQPLDARTVAEQESAADAAAAPSEPVQQVDPDPVSVRIVVDAVDSLASRIPPDQEPLSAAEQNLWTGVVTHSMARLGMVTLPLWLEVIAAVTTTFGTRLASWYKHRQPKPAAKPAQQAQTSQPGRVDLGAFQ